MNSIKDDTENSFEKVEAVEFGSRLQTISRHYSTPFYVHSQIANWLALDNHDSINLIPLNGTAKTKTKSKKSLINNKNSTNPKKLDHYSISLKLGMRNIFKSKVRIDLNIGVKTFTLLLINDNTTEKWSILNPYQQQQEEIQTKPFTQLSFSELLKDALYI